MLFALKFFLDHFIALHIFGRSWSLIDYLIPTQSFTILSLPRTDQPFFFVMTTLAVPFVLIGLVLTLRRLRDAGLPALLVILFFLPILNLLFFLALSIIPTAPIPVIPIDPSDSAALSSEPHPATQLPYASDDPARHQIALARLLPIDRGPSLLFSALIPVPVSLLLLYLGVTILQNYGWGVFIGLPFVTGLAAALLHGYRTPRSLMQCLVAASLAQMFVALALICFALEGAVCILMAAPLLWPVALLGGAFGFALQRRPERPSYLGNVLFAMLIALPLFLGAEPIFLPDAPTYRVVTSVDIDAPLEAVWRQVVAFPPLPKPTEFPFRLGVAYPRRATISGRGVGAIRYCTFSTGSFVEPITTWDQPRLLAFDVIQNPAPLTEWSPFASIHPPHLDDFLTARHGQFRLIPLPGNRTRLEGTTWYQHHMWPAAYW